MKEVTEKIGKYEVLDITLLLRGKIQALNGLYREFIFYIERDTKPLKIFLS